ncbi:MAG TPA: GNAT family N-acetyltransferase [Ilumatobacteraceae bacterium]|nr:GNAT family N-acetyltransferase [Ilumatobacteraceae bacterium]
MAIVTHLPQIGQVDILGSVEVMATVRDNPAQHRYEITDDDHLAGFVEYTIDGDLITFPHTETLPGNEGKGLARQLVEFALADARERHLDVAPACWFVSKVIAGKPDEYLDLVPADSRATYNLPHT